MANLKQAHHELFRRGPDERYASLQELWEYCQRSKKQSLDRWHHPHQIAAHPLAAHLQVELGSDGAFELNDWSFSQLCKLACVSKDTLNRVSADTASRVFAETFPEGKKPLQFLTMDQSVRSVHGVAYTRLWDADLVMMIREFATDFQPPPAGFNGATGLYAGEQDIFCFLIDPTGWAEIDGQAFAPGFFVWNSEVGKRSVGMSTFWFQAVCQNHIVWDAVEITEFTRKHTANVHEALTEMRRMIETLVQKRDERRDGFVKLMRKAMQSTLGEDAEEVEMILAKNGITRALAKEAIEIAREKGRFTIFALVDALTRIAGKANFAGDRTDADQKAGILLALAT